METLIGTSEGVIKLRSARRMGSKEEWWNEERPEGTQGTPGEPTPGSEGNEVKFRVNFREEGRELTGPKKGKKSRW